MRLRIIIAVAMLATGCSRERMVKIGWDPPPEPVSRYQVFVDDRMVHETPPPPVDAACQCLVVSVSVPQGAHVIRVVAYSASGKASTPATLNVQ